MKSVFMAVYVILQYSYNTSPDLEVAGGICQSAFFIDNRTAITAYHNFNSSLFQPVKDYNKVNFWLISRDGEIIPIEKGYLIDYPEIDATIIRFPADQPVEVIKLSENSPQEGIEVISLGYNSEKIPKVKFKLVEDELELINADLSEVTDDREGTIRKLIPRKTVTAPNINLRKINLFALSFGGIVGMSGGPVLSKSTGRAVGLLSIGLPVGVNVKQNLYAISIEEITKRIDYHK